LHTIVLLGCAAVPGPVVAAAGPRLVVLANSWLVIITAGAKALVLRKAAAAGRFNIWPVHPQPIIANYRGSGPGCIAYSNYVQPVATTPFHLMSFWPRHKAGIVVYVNIINNRRVLYNGNILVPGKAIVGKVGAG